MLPIAIPTYNRYGTISHKTLAYLRYVNYPREQITLFVSDIAQRDLYSMNVPAELYGSIVVGVKGLKEQRNFITNYYPENSLLISMDDDIKTLDLPMPFLTLVENAVETLEASPKGGLFGILPNDDARRYVEKTTSHLAFIIGAFYIYRIHKDILCTTKMLHDYELSILYFKRYGTVYRYRGGGIQTTFKKGSGGLNETSRYSDTLGCVLYLTQTYPDMVKRKDKKGNPDLLLNWRYKI